MFLVAGMFMYIMSQDKKMLCKCIKVRVEKNYGGGKNQKYAIRGTTELEDANYLGFYEEEKLALAELQNIFDAIANGEKVYIVK